MYNFLVLEEGVTTPGQSVSHAETHRQSCNAKLTTSESLLVLTVADGMILAARSSDDPFPPSATRNGSLPSKQGYQWHRYKGAKIASQSPPGENGSKCM